jgi:hypothetical protein
MVEAHIDSITIRPGDGLHAEHRNMLTVTYFVGWIQTRPWAKLQRQHMSISCLSRKSGNPDAIRYIHSPELFPPAS